MTDVPRIDQPRAGTYSMKLAKGALQVAVRIWHGQPIIDGEVQDRSLRWCAEVDGETDRPLYNDDGLVVGREPIDAAEVWERCCGRPISEHEYRFLLRRKAWAVEHAPDHPAANPYKPIDLRTLEPGW